jgi:osmotically-inducible protein OsmY
MKSDSQIREEVIQELRWDPQVTDPDAIGVAVKDGAVTLTGAVSTYARKFAAVRAGWVTLNGEVEWQYQRLEVERMVQHVHGVVGISNNIIVTPKVSPGQVQAKIEEAFKREAEIDARHISVAVSDHTASLYGHVHSLNEANAARAAAASAPGIASVESHLVVTP